MKVLRREHQPWPTIIVAFFTLAGYAAAFVNQYQSLELRRGRSIVERISQVSSTTSFYGQQIVRPPVYLTFASSVLYMWRQTDELQGTDRIKACIPYVLPLLDGDQFGHFIYNRIPILGSLNEFFLGPLVSMHHKIPFFGIGLFVALTLGTRLNTSMSRNVRFNAQQAALIDVALIFPELIAGAFKDEQLPVWLVEPCCTLIWYCYMSAVVYSVYSNLQGRKPNQIPFLSGSAELMVGPF